MLLLRLDLKPETIPVTTDKGSNIVVATAIKIRTDCAATYYTLQLKANGIVQNLHIAPWRN